MDKPPTIEGMDAEREAMASARAACGCVVCATEHRGLLEDVGATLSERNQTGYAVCYLGRILRERGYVTETYRNASNVERVRAIGKR